MGYVIVRPDVFPLSWYSKSCLYKLSYFSDNKYEDEIKLSYVKDEELSEYCFDFCYNVPFVMNDFKIRTSRRSRICNMKRRRRVRLSYYDIQSERRYGDLCFFKRRYYKAKRS